uniref:Tyrosine-protein kinase ephrin type A/B receptor-like domain-containing protein n=1 Tax=Alexandrium catenella TaxID=2925 RepID=A0A7S1PJQ5_ALECA
MDHSMVTAQSQFHLPLQYYLSYSNTKISLQDFFDDPRGIPDSELLPCSQNNLGMNEMMAGNYRKFYGSQDPEGTVDLGLDSSGQVKYAMNCSGPGRGVWWLSPKCRENQSRCIPAFSGGVGWWIDEIVFKAVAWDMPVAVAVLANWGKYTTVPKQRRSVFYWWWPDALFTDQRPSSVIFPTHNKVERLAGDLRTAMNVVELEKWAVYATTNRSNLNMRRPLAMLENYELTPQLFESILQHYIRLGGTMDIMEQLVCEWLNNNTNIWLLGTKKWLPEETTCEVGQGIVSSTGEWVESRVQAQSCAWCAPGRMSERIAAESTYKCAKCLPGTFQSTKGETECTECPVGEEAPQAGQKECTRCGLGKFATSNGQVTCDRCLQGFITAYVGSTGVDSCICREGFYRDTANRDACLACEKGMTCPQGSDALGYQTSFSERYPIVPLVDTGYWASAEEPLWIFRCESGERCPGGRRPGKACAAKLNDQGCAHCDKDHVWNGERCTSCGSPEVTTLLFPIAPFILCPILIISLYKLFGDSYARWGTWQNGAAASVFILLNHYQIANILKATNLAWPATVSQVMDVFKYTSDVATIFRPSCSGFGDFKSLLIVRALAPCFLAFMYIFIWSISQLVGRRYPALKMEPNRTLNGFFSLIFTFFAGITEAAFTIFKCSPNPNGTASLQTDRSITCSSAEWNSMAIIGILAVLFWVIGIGLLFIRSIMTAPQYFHNKDMQMRWKFLFIRYRADVHWWAVIFVLKGIFLNLGSVIITTGVGQLFWINICLLLYSGTLAVYRPWRHMPNNGMDAVAHLTLMLAAAVATWYGVDAVDNKASADKLVSTILTVFLFTCWLPCPVIIPTLIMRERSARFLDNKDRNVELIIDAFEVVMSSDKEDRELFLQSLGEWDFWFMLKAKDIIQTTFAKRKCRTGYSVHSLDDLQVETFTDRKTRRSFTRISSGSNNGRTTKTVTSVRF